MSTLQNQNVFKDFLTNKTYQIPKKLISRWPIFRNRYTLGVAMGVLLWSFNIDLLFSLCLSIAFIVVSEIMFRTNFLPKCKQVEFSAKQKKDTPPQAKIILTLAWAATAVLLYLLYKDSNGSQISQSLILAGSILALFVSLSQWIQLIMNRK